MILTKPTKSRTSAFMILDGSYLKLFDQAVKNHELNKIEDKNNTARFSKETLKTEKAG
jgi:hypothetical protein